MFESFIFYVKSINKVFLKDWHEIVNFNFKYGLSSDGWRTNNLIYTVNNKQFGGKLSNLLCCCQESTYCNSLVFQNRWVKYFHLVILQITKHKFYNIHTHLVYLVSKNLM